MSSRKSITLWIFNRFLKIKLRQPEGTILNRIASFNRETVKDFILNFRLIQTEYLTITKRSKEVGSAIPTEKASITGVFLCQCSSVGVSCKRSWNDFINSELFFEWSSHIAKHAKPNSSDPSSCF